MAKNFLQRLFGNTSPDEEDSMIEIDGETIEITFEDLQPKKKSPLPAFTGATGVAPASAQAASAPLTPQQLAQQQFGVNLNPPSRGEHLYVGFARQPNSRQETETYWPSVFSQQALQRTWQVFTFILDIRDANNNPVEFVAVEVRGLSISGMLPSDGTPTAVYGKPGKDNVVHTYQVINLHTRSSLTVTAPRGWRGPG